MLGFSIPPFDMIWLMETIRDHAEEVGGKEIKQKINNKIRENRLLYELGAITKEEYDIRNRELNCQRRMNRQVDRMNLTQRINLLS